MCTRKVSNGMTRSVVQAFFHRGHEKCHRSARKYARYKEKNIFDKRHKCCWIWISLIGNMCYNILRTAKMNFHVANSCKEVGLTCWYLCWVQKRPTTRCMMTSSNIKACCCDTLGHTQTTLTIINPPSLISCQLYHPNLYFVISAP